MKTVAAYFSIFGVIFWGFSLRFSLSILKLREEIWAILSLEHALTRSTGCSANSVLCWCCKKWEQWATIQLPAVFVSSFSSSEGSGASRPGSWRRFLLWKTTKSGLVTCGDPVKSKEEFAECPSILQCAILDNLLYQSTRQAWSYGFHKRERFMRILSTITLHSFNTAWCHQHASTYGIVYLGSYLAI